MRDWVAKRMFPLIASALLMAIGMITTTIGPTMIGRSEWALPYDYWGTLLAAVRLAHGNVGGLYTQPTGLVSLPGAAVILFPVAVIIAATGLSLRIPGPHNLHPGVWVLAGPYQIAVSCVALFAADALAERLGVSRGRRALLAAASGVALWNVSCRWGHPEDAVAVGLLLYAVLAFSRQRVSVAAWLTGAAVCVQPLVLLAVPVLAAVLPWRRMPRFLGRAALPSVVLLAAALIANWHAAWAAVTSQPDSPVINHPTLWTPLAPHMSGGNVAAGPFRLAAIVVACGCALAIRRRWAGAHDAESAGPWPAELLSDVLWWAALALALRSFFEPVMVSYYPWPVLALALIPAALGWRRLIWASLVAGAITAAAQGTSHNAWIWWVPIVLALAVLLALARRRRPREAGSARSAIGRARGWPKAHSAEPGEEALLRRHDRGDGLEDRALWRQVVAGGRAVEAAVDPRDEVLLRPAGILTTRGQPRGAGGGGRGERRGRAKAGAGGDPHGRCPGR